MLKLFFKTSYLWRKYQAFETFNGSMRAAALTFYTLFSIVPMLALCFGVAKGFDLEHYLSEQLNWYLEGQNETISALLHFSNTLIQHAHGGIIAFIGCVFLLWSLFKVFFILEETLNQIFKAHSSRSFIKQLLNYTLFVLLAPFLWIASSLFSFFLHDQIYRFFNAIDFLKPWLPYFTLNRFVPILLMTLLLTWLYAALPNKHISMKKTLLPAFLVALSYYFIQWIYILFQIGIASNGAIYGSFAALPLFLLWLELSWHLILFGAVLCANTS